MIILHSLGQCHIDVNGTRLTPAQPLVFALALYVILTRGKPTPRSVFHDLFWESVTNRHAVQNRFRQTAYQLRQLGFDIAKHGDVVLSPHLAEADYEALVAADETVRGALLQSDLYFLPHYDPPFSGAFAEWITERRGDVHDRLLRVLHPDMARAEQRQDWKTMEAIARQCIRLEPLNKVASEGLARALVMQGWEPQAVHELRRHARESGDDERSGLLERPVALQLAERLHGAGYSANRRIPFVGRRESTRLLFNAVERAKTSEGTACFVWGEAGIGKSRLTEEVERYAVNEDVLVVRGRCLEGDGQLMPLSLFATLLPSVMNLPGAGGCFPETRTILERLSKHDVLAAPTPESHEAEFLHAKIRLALFDLFGALTHEDPVLLVIEDVHWIDHASAGLLGDLISWCASQALTIVITSRRSYEDSFHRSASAKLITHQLTSLAPNDMAQLAEEFFIAYEKRVSPKQRQAILRFSEGNPFYLREFITYLSDKTSEVRTPPSLAVLLDSRVERLTRKALHTLQTAILLGRHATLERLSSVLDFKSHDLFSVIDELGQAEMIIGTTEESLDGITVTRLECRHDLLSAHTISRLSGQAKSFLHRRIAELLEREISGYSPTSILWDCADHWQQAGNKAKAYSLAYWCARHSTEMGQMVDALQGLERCLDYTQTSVQKLALLEELAANAAKAGEWEPAAEAAIAAHRLHIEVNPTESSHTASELIIHHAMWRNGDRLLDVLRNLIHCATDNAASPDHRAEAAILTMMIAADTGEGDVALRGYRAISQLIKQGLVSKRLALKAEMMHQTLFGDPALAVEPALQLNTIERANGNPLTYVKCTTNTSSVLLRAGMFMEAYQLRKEAFEIMQKYQVAFERWFYLHRMLLLCVNYGFLDKAKHWISVAEAGNYIDNIEHVACRYLVLDIMRYALETGDIDKANRLGELLSADKSPVNRSAQLACLIHLHLTLKSPPHHIEDLVNEMEPLYRRLWKLGGQDYETHWLYQGLCFLGRGDCASQLLAEYITENRRERWALPRYLSELTNAIVETSKVRA